MHDGRDFFEFLELLVVKFRVNRIRRVASLLSTWLVGVLLGVDLHLLAVGGVADLLDSELDSADFENISLLDFVVLKTKSKDRGQISSK